MSDSLQGYSVAVNAAGQVETRSLGSYTYLHFMSCPLPFQFSIDGTTFNAGYQGLRLGPFSKSVTVSLKSSGLASSIFFYASTFPLAYFPNTIQQPTFQVGNLGLKVSGVYYGQNITFNAGYPGWIQVGTTVAAGVTVYDNLNGKTRKAAIVTCLGVYGSTFNSLQLVDQNGCNMMTVAPTSSIVVETGGPFSIISMNERGVNAGLAFFQVNEIYYNFF